MKTLYGEDIVFPDTYRRYNKTKFEALADNGMLTEGLIRSYPLEWVGQYITNHANTDFISAGMDEDKNQIWAILKPSSKSIEPFKKKMEAFGYFCSVESNVKEGVYLQFEAKFDIYRKGSEFRKTNNGVVFYHVAPIRFKAKTMEKGLIPKSTNPYLKYPDRIYFLLASDGKDKAYDMADILYNEDDNKTNDGKYTLFGITLDGLENIKLFPDRNTPFADAWFTYENIPSTNIVFVEYFNAYKF